MSHTVLASSWYRVAGLKPRLRMQARLHRHRYRGEVWYLLQDRATNRVHRFRPGARLFIAAMDGERTVQKLWEITNKHLGAAAPTQDEIIHLLGQLHAADLLQSDVTPDVAELLDRGDRQERAKRRRSYMNPMALRIHLLDPDAFLNQLTPFIRAAWSGWGGLLWLAVVLPALLLVPPHWSELTNNFTDRVLAVDNLLVLLVVFPLIKALHELGHAAATKRGGGEVHDMGIIVLVLFPVPYVEASAASVFKSKWERAVVGAAGMVVEVFLAALAFYLWLLAEAGPVRAILFNVMLIAGVSTLIFNGNPLLRFDAYYMLADLLEIPNLANRSQRYWGYLVERYGFGIRDADRPHGSAREKAWLLFYGVASFVYRITVTIAIALFIAGKFFLIGVLLALWVVFAMAILPLCKVVKHLASSPRLQQRRARAIAVSAAGVALVVLAIFVAPAPQRTTAEGVVWLPEQALVRAGQDGFLAEILAGPGARVVAGELLAESYDPTLEADIRLHRAKLAEVEAEYAMQFATDRAQAAIVREQVESVRAALALLIERRRSLSVRAERDGIFITPRAADMPGRHFRKGELLGYVLGDDRPSVRVVVPQHEADLVRLGTNRVRVRYAHDPGRVLEGRIVRSVPAGEEYLPSRALGTEGGGRIATDPRDQKGAKAMERLFQLDLEISGQEADHRAYFGERVYARFDHERIPFGLQWYRSIRLLFLSHFNV